VRRGCKLLPKDYLALALLLVGILYFQKFLWRADSDHLQQAFLVSAPIVVYIADRVFRRRVIVFRALFMVGIVAAGPTIAMAIDSFPQRIMRSMPVPQGMLRLGYTQESSDVVQTARALQPIIASAHGPIFDFTNEPALFHFSLGARPATAFFHVSMAISRESQTLLIRKLAENPPELVVYASQGEMWHWDGIPNSVRHRYISEYLLRNWEPLSSVKSYLMLRR